MTLEIERTGLWKRTLAYRSDDKDEVPRSKLRSALLSMRLNAVHLVKMIPSDCEGLTVHDISHLDALWETADLIAGDNFQLNPAEAFAFGAAVLLHDAGMSIASYPGGISSLTDTLEWRDTASSFLRRNNIANSNPSDVNQIPAALRKEVIFTVLRLLHAKHAEDLVSARWTVPGSLDQICILEDQHLRSAYGPRIGRIAHSHHWNIERVADELRSDVGAATELPRDWTLNEIKVACLLRCADAAHIDHRRAPSMLYALTQPHGVSAEHWNFQNKLNKPTLKDGVLLFSSGQDFTLNEANSWWLCYDAIKMIDKELASCNALMQDSNLPTFLARRVYGAESPTILSKQVRPVGWRPVDAEIRVTNPVHLAKTLGGRNLYGQSNFAPIRELLQNAVDAVRARRRYEQRESGWGRIRLTIEHIERSNKKEIWLHVDDTGIGMSERVLAGPLLDFGRSFWNSSLLSEEFPGLESRGIQPIGKFGIGFFSVFLLGNNVKVTTRKYNGASADTRTLVFESVASRPLLRDAKSGELPLDYTTRVSVKLSKSENYVAEVRVPRRTRPYSYSDVRHLGVELPLEDLLKHIRQLVAAVDIGIEISCKNKGVHHIHNASWTEISSVEFLNNILVTEEEIKDRVVEIYAGMLAVLKDEEGNIYGRAAIMIVDTLDKESDYAGAGRFFHISVGGFLYAGYLNQPAGGSLAFVGVVNGKTNDVSRKFAVSDVPASVLSSWSTEQAKLFDRKRFDISQQVDFCHSVVQLEGDPSDLPFCFWGGQFISFSQFKEHINKADSIYIPIDCSYGKNFTLINCRSLTTNYFTLNVTDNIVVNYASRGNSNLFGEKLGKQIFDARGYDFNEKELERSLPDSLKIIIEQAKSVWGTEPKTSVKITNIFKDNLYVNSSSSWSICISR